MALQTSSPGGSDGKESTCSAADLGSTPQLGRSPGGGHDNPLQNSCLEYPHGQGSLVDCSPWGCKELDTTEWLSTHDMTKESVLGYKKQVREKKEANFLLKVLRCWVKLTLSVQFSSVTQSCPTLCDPMHHSTPGLPVNHQLPEFTQTYVHQASDPIQPSHPLSSPSPPAFNLSQHQGLFKWVSSLHQVAKGLEFQLQHQSFQWTPRTDLL